MRVDGSFMYPVPTGSCDCCGRSDLPTYLTYRRGDGDIVNKYEDCAECACLSNDEWWARRLGLTLEDYIERYCKTNLVCSNCGRRERVLWEVVEQSVNMSRYALIRGTPCLSCICGGMLCLPE